MSLEFGDLAAWIAAAVAVIAAIFASRQAVHARRQADAAEKQAAEACREIEIMQADRHDRRTPKFAPVEAVDVDDEHGFRAAKLIIRLDEGPPLESVALRVSGDCVNYIYDPTAPHAASESAKVLSHVRPGHTHTVYLACEDGHIDV